MSLLSRCKVRYYLALQTGHAHRQNIEAIKRLLTLGVQARSEAAQRKAAEAEAARAASKIASSTTSKTKGLSEEDKLKLLQQYGQIPEDEDIMPSMPVEPPLHTRGKGYKKPVITGSRDPFSLSIIAYCPMCRPIAYGQREQSKSPSGRSGKANRVSEASCC